VLEQLSVSLSRKKKISCLLTQFAKLPTQNHLMPQTTISSRMPFVAIMHDEKRNDLTVLFIPLTKTL
jgi:hypothetical protein